MWKRRMNKEKKKILMITIVKSIERLGGNMYEKNTWTR